MTVPDYCASSSTPKGVALRWLDYLQQEEMVVETADPECTDQILIRLSETTHLALSAYLASLMALGLREEHCCPTRIVEQTKPARDWKLRLFLNRGENP